MIQSVGTNKNVSRSEMIRAAHFFLEKLVGLRLTKNLDVMIMCRDSEVFHGTADWIDRNLYPREFEIMINRGLSKEDQLVALAHELVHVKQYARGELKEVLVGPTKLKWKGQFFLWEKDNYWDTPWEIEAREVAETLYKEYVNA